MTEESKSHYMKRKRWTEAEKKMLLKGLKKHGSTNAQNLKYLLPNKSVFSITQMIKKYEAIADLGKKEVNSPLDVWLRSGIFNEEDPLISEALLFIYLYEDHPPPRETANFDLRKAYKFLYEATKENVVTNLPEKTVEMFQELISTVDKEMWPSSECCTTDYLIGKLCTTPSEKCYKRKRES